MKKDWKKIIEVLLDPCRPVRDSWKKEYVKHILQEQYGSSLIKGIEARQRSKNIIL